MIEHRRILSGTGAFSSHPELRRVNTHDGVGSSVHAVVPTLGAILSPQGHPIRTQDITDLAKKINRSKLFFRAIKLQRFIDYIILETIEGRQNNIKSYSIAIEVFGRSEDFDSAIDSSVRTAANRLRLALERYYHTEGVAEDIVISLPKGRYIPQFEVISKIVPIETSGKVESRRTDDIALLVLPCHSSIESVPISVSDEFHNRIVEYLVKFGAISVVDVKNIKTLGSAIQDSQNISVPRTQFAISFDLYSSRYEIYASWKLTNMLNGIVVAVGETQRFPLNEHSVRMLTKSAAAALLGSDGALVSLLHRSSEGGAGTVGLLAQAQKTVVNQDESRLSPLLKALEEFTLENPLSARAWALISLGYSLLRYERNSTGVDCQDLFIYQYNSAVKAVRIQKDAYMSQISMMIMQFDWRRYDHFREQAKRMIADFGEDPSLLALIGGRLVICGNYEEGITHLEEGKRVEFSCNPINSTLLSLGYYALEQWDKALRPFETIIEDDTYLHKLVGAAILSRLGEHRHAREKWSELISSKPGYAGRIRGDLRVRGFASALIEKLIQDLRVIGADIPES